MFSCVATAELPLTVADVRGALGDQLPYNAVLTTLSRLHSKGVLHSERDGQAFAYSVADHDPRSLDPILIARRMTQLLEAESDHGNVLARFVACLPTGDQRLLAELVSRRCDTAGAQP